MHLYIHAYNPHFSATWADFCFEHPDEAWMICDTKGFPLEPLYNCGCKYACGSLVNAVMVCKDLHKHGIINSWTVVKPVGANGKPATGGDIFKEYSQHLQT